MIEFKSGNIFDEDVEAIVNTVNCVGVMGRGIALQFKKRYPENFLSYESACKKGLVQPGEMFVYKTNTIANPKYIINFPTKLHWRQKSRIEDIKSGLADLVDVILKSAIKSIAVPPLGCGLGGLQWVQVKEELEAALGDIDGLKVIVYEPQSCDARETVFKPAAELKITPGRAALVELCQRYIGGLLDPFLTLLEVHKLMYFLQESGENLRLNYVKGFYGPYAENLRHVLNAVEGHFLVGFAEGDDKPDKKLELVPGAFEISTKFLEQHTQTKQRFNRVSELIEGFESPFGLELLSTVHWVITKEGAYTKQELVEKIYEWNDRKRQFSERQIEIAGDVLAQKGWVNFLV